MKLLGLKWNNNQMECQIGQILFSVSLFEIFYTGTYGMELQVHKWFIAVNGNCLLSGEPNGLV